MGTKIVFLNISQGKVQRGSETFVKEVSDRLIKAGHNVEIVTDRKSHASSWPILWRFYLDPQGFQILFFTLRVLPKIWKEKFDVVIPLNGGWQAALVRLITWFYGGKMVVSGQSGIGWDDRNNLWCFPDRFVAISRVAQMWAKKANPFVEVGYIPNGVDLNKFKPDGSTINTKLKKPVILCVAALTEQKRIDLVIKAVARLKTANLLIVGNGDLKSEIEFMGRKLLGNRFQLMSLPHKEMPSVYRSADLFTLASTSSEAFGIVYVEAMASGLPVVATDDPIRREIVADAGILVDPIDTEAYVSALEKALSINWGEKPRKQAEKFSWDKIADEYEALFLSLLK